MAKGKVFLKDLPHHKNSFADRSADRLAKVAGSWGFIFGMAIFIFIWMWLNVTAFIGNWDPWPFILLNLTLSSLAVFQAPIILMSQNRAADIDRRRSEYDYKIDRKTQREIQEIKKELKSIKRLLVKKK